MLWRRRWAAFVRFMDVALVALAALTAWLLWVLIGFTYAVRYLLLRHWGVE